MKTFAQLAASLGLTAEEALRQRNEVREAMNGFSPSVAAIKGSSQCVKGCRCPRGYSMCRYRVREMQRIAFIRGYDMQVVEHGGWGLPGQDMIDTWAGELHWQVYEWETGMGRFWSQPMKTAAEARAHCAEMEKYGYTFSDSDCPTDCPSTEHAEGWLS